MIELKVGDKVLKWVSNKTNKSSCEVTIYNDMSNRYIPYIKPITLTDDEKTILRNVDGKYKWIARDMEIEPGLWVFEDKPYKLNLEWDGQNYESLDCFNHLFQQIKWEDEEPCLIADLIK